MTEMIHSVFGCLSKGKRHLTQIIVASMASVTMAKSITVIWMIPSFQDDTLSRPDDISVTELLHYGALLCVKELIQTFQLSPPTCLILVTGL